MWEEARLRPAAKTRDTGEILSLGARLRGPALTGFTRGSENRQNSRSERFQVLDEIIHLSLSQPKAEHAIVVFHDGT